MPDLSNVARTSCPEPSSPSSNKAQTPSDRAIWAQTCTRIAQITGAFCLILAILLVINSYQLYRGPGNGKVRLVEARELIPLKTALRQNPRDDLLKQQIRQLDQQLRREYFRRELLASRGGWILLGGLAVFLAALKLSKYLRRPAIPIPNISPRPADPTLTAARAAKSVAGTALALATLTTVVVWNTSQQWLPALTQSGASPATTTAAANTAPAAAIDPAWFPPPEEIAKNWPYFRGPDGSGVTTLNDLPTTWDGPTGKNVLWKSETGLPGESSPVVWGPHVFLTGATAKRREVYCYDAASGKLLWKEPVSTPQGDRAEPPEVTEDTGFAASTAATDGRRVFAIFANGDVTGFTADGKRLWARNLGTPESTYGHAASLTLWHNRVIVVFDQATAKDAKSKIIALDSSTGDPVWTTPRPVANSWVSPIIIHYQDHEQIITSADPFVIAYDPATGKEIWKAKCMHGDVATSPSYANNLIYVGCTDTCIAAIKPDGTGDVTDSHIAWQQEDAGLPDLCSLLCDGPHLYSLVNGVFHAFDALTGDHLWQFNSKINFQSSPALVNGHILLVSTKGTAIFGDFAKDGFKESGRCELGEPTGASPAFMPGRIYLRSRKHLFCIGNKDGK